MQVSEADDEGERDTTALAGDFEGKQVQPRQKRKKSEKAQVESRITFGESRLGEAVAAVRAGRCPEPR